MMIIFIQQIDFGEAYFFVGWNIAVWIVCKNDKTIKCYDYGYE